MLMPDGRGPSYVMTAPPAIAGQALSIATLSIATPKRELRVEVNLSALSRLQDLLDRAWGIIANANGGNWDAPTGAGSKFDAEWKAAAEKWRDDLHGGPPG